MDFIKDKIEDIVEKIKKDPKLLQKFKDEPIKTVEGLIGIDLPDAEIEKLAELIKAKIDLDKADDMLKGLGGLFNKYGKLPAALQPGVFVKKATTHYVKLQNKGRHMENHHIVYLYLTTFFRR